MAQTLHTAHPLPNHAAWCCVVPGFLTQQECLDLVAQSEARGFVSAATDYPPSYRNNDRQVMDDAELADHLLQRVKAHVPATVDGNWSLHAINERFRLCRYGANQQFNIHQDGIHHRDANTESRLTFLVYLNDGEEFDGGDTLFFAGGPAGGAPACIARVRPRVGSLIVFDHDLWHAGEQVTAGVKHILRSDVLYRRVATPQDVTDRTGHRGYVWTLAALTPHILASGGRDATIRLWSDQGEPLRVLHGHGQSVLGLAALPHGRLASVSRDRSLRIWNWQTGACERTTENAHAGAVLCVKALPAGGLATGGADGQIHLWSDEGTRRATLCGHSGWVWDMALLPQGRIASASEDGSIRIWDTAAATQVALLVGDIALHSLDVAPDGTQIASANIAGDITIWSQHLQTWCQATSIRAHGAAIRRVRYIRGDCLASAAEDHTMKRWSLPQLELQDTALHGNFVTDVFAMGDAVVSACYDGNIRFMDNLQQQWIQTWTALGLADATGEQSLALLQALLQAYREPHRKYHTEQHLRECLGLCTRDAALAQHPGEVAMALWFHDAIYAHGRNDNEQASADWAQRALRTAGAAEAMVKRVVELILATCHRNVPQTHDAQLLVDIDLAILGAAPERFQAYEQQIRDEYSHIATRLFRSKRREVLQSFVDRKSIYATATYHDRFEAIARANLQRSLDE